MVKHSLRDPRPPPRPPPHPPSSSSGPSSTGSGWSACPSGCCSSLALCPLVTAGQVRSLPPTPAGPCCPAALALLQRGTRSRPRRELSSACGRRRLEDAQAQRGQGPPRAWSCAQGQPRSPDRHMAPPCLESPLSPRVPSAAAVGPLHPRAAMPSFPAAQGFRTPQEPRPEATRGLFAERRPRWSAELLQAGSAGQTGSPALLPACGGGTGGAPPKSSQLALRGECCAPAPPLW